MLLLSGCSSKQLPQAIAFPERDIVFQANDGENYAIGFINADGSEPVIFPTGEIRISQPVWSQDRKTIYFRWIRRDPGTEFPGAGEIGYLRDQAKSPTWCEQPGSYWAIYPIPGEEAVLYDRGIDMGILDLKKCRSKEILVDYSKDERRPISVGYPSVSRDGMYVLYTEIFHGQETEYNIIKIDRRIGKSQKIGEGISPVLSPDNRQIAFVRPDGIYRMDFDGGNVEKLVDYRPPSALEYEGVPPIPQWSPDGKALVYHKCMTSSPCTAGSSFRIYTYQFSDGIEDLLYEGGLYPYWP